MNTIKVYNKQTLCDDNLDRHQLVQNMNACIVMHHLYQSVYMYCYRSRCSIDALAYRDWQARIQGGPRGPGPPLASKKKKKEREKERERKEKKERGGEICN